MSLGLSVNDVTNVQVIMAPTAAQGRNFGNLMIVGSSPVIDVTTRFRLYTTLAQVGVDFGTSAAEYLAATRFFGQTPVPTQVYIGRWAQTATSAQLFGAPLTATQQLITTWQAYTTPGFFVVMNGVPYAIAPASFASVTNLNGVAALIQTALAASVANSLCVWNSTYNYFEITDGTTGVTSTTSFLKAPTAVGSATFSGQPTAADTITIGGTVVTFVSALTTGNQILIGSSLTATLANALTFLQASTDTNLIKFNYYVVGSVLYFSAVTAGVSGNSLTLVKSSAAITLSGATLAGGSATDISAAMNMNSTSTGAYAVQGIGAETLLSAVNTLAVLSNDWYGLYNASPSAVTSDYQAVAGFIQAATPSRMFGVTTQDPNTIVTGNMTSLGYLLNQAAYTRTFIQYSSLDPYAAISEFGRFLTVDPTGNNTTITMKFKQEPGVLAELLTEQQAQALAAINCNVFVQYNNSTSIVQQGQMCYGYYIDEIWGLDWLANYVQTNVYNALYGSPTKIPQTDPGVNILVGVVNQSLQQGVNNGLLAPGVWTGPTIGSLQTGQTLTAGYYVFAAPVASQTAAQRGARVSPPIQACVKLAGAIHSANVIINVNR